MNRGLKQLIYGALYLLIIAGIVYIPTRIFKAAPSCSDGILNQDEEGVDCGGSCQDCAILSLKPIVVLPKVIQNPLNLNKTILFTELRNPNAAYGASAFTYSVVFYGKNNEVLSTYSQDSLIYAGEVTYRTDLTLDVPFDQITRVEGSSVNPRWKSLAEMISPKTQVRDLQARFEDERGRLVITGIIKNDNAFDIRRAVIHALVSQTGGGVVGVSKAIVQDLTPLEDRAFEIFMPVPSGVNPEMLSRPTLYIEVVR